MRLQLSGTVPRFAGDGAGETMRVSGWILPDGEWVECDPWDHIRAAKGLPLTEGLRAKNPQLDELWAHHDDEMLRACLAELGFIKVCYHLVDANELSLRQLKRLQELFAGFDPELELEFIGRIRLKLQVRLLLKIRDPERLNSLI